MGGHRFFPTHHHPRPRRAPARRTTCRSSPIRSHESVTIRAAIRTIRARNGHEKDMVWARFFAPRKATTPAPAHTCAAAKNIVFRDRHGPAKRTHPRAARYPLSSILPSASLPPAHFLPNEPTRALCGSSPPAWRNEPKSAIRTPQSATPPPDPKFPATGSERGLCLRARRLHPSPDRSRQGLPLR
jgi:hypothetical protein